FSGLFTEADLTNDLFRGVEHHAQLAGDGDELPAFVDAEADLVGAATMQTRSDLIPSAGFQDSFRHLSGSFAAGRLSVRSAHAGSQVVRTNENRVDAGHGENGVGILDGRDVLAL